MKFGAISKKFFRGWLPVLAIGGMLILAGCATSQPYGYNNRTGYGTTYGNGYGSAPVCHQCGVVQSVRQINVDPRDTSHVLGTVIGAVVGGLVGNQVGGGTGKKIATVAGAVAGGAVGHHVAEARDTAYQIIVRLDDGRTATVTQRGNPHVQRGDRVQIRNDKVYAK